MVRAQGGRQGAGTAVANDFQGDGLTRAAHYQLHGLFPTVQGYTVDGGHDISVQHTRYGGRAGHSRGDLAADPLHRGGQFGGTGVPEQAEQQQERGQEVERHPGQHHHRLLPEGLLPIRAARVDRVDLLADTHAGDPHVAAEQEHLHTEFGLSAAERPQSRPEAEEELGGLHSGGAGRPVVTGLVHDDERRDGHHHHYSADQTPLLYRRSTAERAARRAARSASITTPIEVASIA